MMMEMADVVMPSSERAGMAAVGTATLKFAAVPAGRRSFQVDVPFERSVQFRNNLL
jgi:hypothetical protein